MHMGEGRTMREEGAGINDNRREHFRLTLLPNKRSELAELGGNFLTFNPRGLGDTNPCWFQLEQS